MIQKDKPLTYIETHAARGLYDLGSAEALKTGESQSGIDQILEKKIQKQNEDNTYLDIIQNIKKTYSPKTYPGSPLIAAHILRKTDTIHLAELHPREIEHLRKNMKSFKNVFIKQEDGLKMANGLIPPTPRRGLMLIDPSYELKEEYEQMADFLTTMHKKWPVGVLTLWYPILKADRHAPMINSLKKVITNSYVHEIRFNRIKNHGLLGSGMFIVNPPYTIDQYTKASNLFQFT